MPAMTFWSRSTPLIWVRLPADDALERVHGEVGVERVGPEGGDPGHLVRIFRDQYTARRFCVPASVRSNPASPSSSASRTRTASGPLPGRTGLAPEQVVAPAQPARPGQVDDQVQAVAVEVEELAVPRHAR